MVRRRRARGPKGERWDDGAAGGILIRCGEVDKHVRRRERFRVLRRGLLAARRARCRRRLFAYRANPRRERFVVLWEVNGNRRRVQRYLSDLYVGLIFKEQKTASSASHGDRQKHYTHFGKILPLNRPSVGRTRTDC